MKLELLLASIAPAKVEGSSDREVTAITYDSRRVSSGSMFVALRGEHLDGATFIPRAVAAGAEAIVAENDFAAGAATKILVPNARDALADLAVCFYEHPARALKIAGVTGTNGKTTTAFLIKHICDQVLHRCGLIGTVQYDVGDRVLPAPRTTPESLDLQELLWQMQAAGCKAAVM